MYRSIKIFVIVIISSSFSFCQENSVDRLKLNEVLLEFAESIKQKDSIGFKKLFFDEQVSFIGIMSKDTEMSIKKDYPDFQGIAVSNSTKFIEDICKTEKMQEENFYNINIETDRNISSISFDYSFYSDTSMMQWGHEKWNLVYVDDKWLITDVIYSIHFPDVESFPYNDKSEKGKE